MNDAPEYTISVVIAAYNAERWIAETLDSILEQTYPPLEIIVVDDGSKDMTGSVIQQYGNKIRYIYQENRGPADARNVGIRAALGQYIAFVDADDAWKPEKLALQVEKLKQGFSWVICDFVNFDDATNQLVREPRQKLPEGDILRALFLENFIGSPTPVVRREIFDEVGYFDNTFKHIGEDWEMWLRIAAKYPLGVVPKKLAHRRLHPHSVTSLVDPKEKLNDLERIIKISALRQPTRLGKIEVRSLIKLHYGLGVKLFKEEKYADAKTLFLNVLKRSTLHVGALAYLTMTNLGPKLSKPFIHWKRRLFTWLRR